MQKNFVNVYYDEATFKKVDYSDSADSRTEYLYEVDRVDFVYIEIIITCTVRFYKMMGRLLPSSSFSHLENVRVF